MKLQLNLLHARVHIRSTSQHSGLESSPGKNLHIVAVSVFGTGPISYPSIGSLIQEAPPGEVEVGERPDVLEVGQLAFGEVWA